MAVKKNEEVKSETKPEAKLAKARKANLFKRIFASVPFQEKVNFARHLSVTIKSGMPLLEGLRLIRGQSASKKFARIIDQVIKDVNNGQFLAQSLENFDYIFGDFFINMVKVGETSGNLSSTLIYLAEELKKQREISHRIKGALIYPAIILVVTIGITLFLTLFIFPKILPIFISLGVQLPFTTKLIIQILSLLQKYGFYILFGLIAVSFGMKALLSIRAVHFLFDNFLLSLPFLGRVIINVTMTNFTRSLSVLLKSGMTIIDALAIAKGTFHNLYYRYEIERIAESVRRGESMARFMEINPKLFPPMLVGMIRVGETTGNLEENLNYLSEYYESEVDDTVRNLTTILEPVLLVVMGLLVGFVALSIITPIYKVTEGLRVR